MAVYRLLNIKREPPPLTPHDKALRTQLKTLVRAFK
jgi:myosin-crossreactive antigen